ncbi:MAG TPA: NAD(P)/FAD-dependent oxidoreductase [Planctomycetota bacterium]|nr:NAD(P)/FAD-dependent oxidoreductase [Planctomycetota bacterium]
MSTHYDCIIIGAGMSGLAAGIRLAYYEKKVCILEKHTMPGGLNSFYRLDGRNFDVGLHAMTNYVPRDVRSAPLNKLLRQLRLKYEDFELCPQRVSDVRFPGMKLRFSNDFSLFESDVCEKFPKQADAFRKLVAHIHAFNELDLNAKPLSARAILNEFLTDPLLIDMILCPLMYYGSANVDDMEFGQFVIMFKSIFCEGFARPRAGVRQIISTLLKQYKACKGELRMGCGVKRLNVEDGRVKSIELDTGEAITATHILSSAGYVETERLCSDVSGAALSEIEARAGQMTFVESISVLDCQPEVLGLDQTITFYNNSDRFRYRPAEGLVDVSSAVVCVPNNFQYETPLGEGIVRVTHIANFAAWKNLSADEYKAKKKECYERSIAEVVKFVPDFRKHVKYIDTFSPLTIKKFTWHDNGAVYGAPGKSKDGRTRLANVFLCGTDQGFLGIIGAMLSGISMANLHVLQGK